MKTARSSSEINGINSSQFLFYFALSNNTPAEQAAIGTTNNERTAAISLKNSTAFSYSEVIIYLNYSLI